MARAKKGLKKFHGLFALHFLNLLRDIRNTRRTLAIQVYLSAKEVGLIYFDKGGLVHAECGKDLGEEAFIQILEAHDGSYLVMDEKTADVVSIERELGLILNEYNNSKSRDKQMPRLTLPVMEDEGEDDSAESAAWTIPETPKYGLQEEVWIRDWGKKLAGFKWARVLKHDTARVMGVEDEASADEVDELEDVISAVGGLADDGKKKVMYLENTESVYVLAGLEEGYMLLIKVEGSQDGFDELRGHLKPLVKALNDTLTQA